MNHFWLLPDSVGIVQDSVRLRNILQDPASTLSLSNSFAITWSFNSFTVNKLKAMELLGSARTSRVPQAWNECCSVLFLNQNRSLHDAWWVLTALFQRMFSDPAVSWGLARALRGLRVIRFIHYVGALKTLVCHGSSCLLVMQFCWVWGFPYGRVWEYGYSWVTLDCYRGGARGESVFHIAPLPHRNAPARMDKTCRDVNFWHRRRFAIASTAASLLWTLVLLCLVAKLQALLGRRDPIRYPATWACLGIWLRHYYWYGCGSMLCKPAVLINHRTR